MKNEKEKGEKRRERREREKLREAEGASTMVVLMAVHCSRIREEDVEEKNKENERRK